MRNIHAYQADRKKDSYIDLPNCLPKEKKNIRARDFAEKYFLVENLN